MDPSDKPTAPEIHPELLTIVEFVAKGWTDERIAQHQGVSVSTVRRRIRAAGEVLGTHSRVSLAVVASRLGLIGDPSIRND